MLLDTDDGKLYVFNHQTCVRASKAPIIIYFNNKFVLKKGTLDYFFTEFITMRKSRPRKTPKMPVICLSSGVIMSKQRRIHLNFIRLVLKSGYP